MLDLDRELCDNAYNWKRVGAKRLTSKTRFAPCQPPAGFLRGGFCFRRDDFPPPSRPDQKPNFSIRGAGDFAAGFNTRVIGQPDHIYQQC
jgi:hypothetical protein